jgi:hypothetical protein
MKPKHGYSDAGREADSPRLSPEQGLPRARAEFILEIHTDVERKLVALGQPLWVSLLSRKPDHDGNRFVEALGPKSREQIVLPERPPGVRVGTASVAFAKLSLPIRYAGIFDAEGNLRFSGAIVPTGKRLIYCLPSVARVPCRSSLPGEASRPEVGHGDAALVRRVFAEHAAGMTTFEIAEMLNLEGSDRGIGTDISPNKRAPDENLP